MPCASLHLPACPPPPQTRQESFSGPLCPHFTWPGCSFLPGGGQRVAVWVSPPVPQTSAWGQRRLWREGEGAGAAGGPAAGSVTVCSLVYSLSPPQVPRRTEHCSCAETLSHSSSRLCFWRQVFVVPASPVTCGRPAWAGVKVSISSRRGPARRVQ